MTDRINAVTVVLEADLRIDDAQDLLNAIRQLRGVASVEPNVSSIEDHVAQERAKRELGAKLWEVLYPPQRERLDR